MILLRRGFALAALVALTGCGLVIDTSPGPAIAPLDSGAPDTTPPDSGTEPTDSGAADSGLEDSGPIVTTDAEPPECTSDSECDDGNPCTDDECDEGECDSEANAADCDDGVFCNGADECSESSCTVHLGDPCTGATLCEEDMATCVGCIEDAHCPGDSTTPWTECGGFSDVCDEEGTRMQTATRFSCVTGTCQRDDTPRTETCPRSTAGVICRMPDEPAWSICAGFATACDTTGTKYRDRTDYACGSGRCDGVTTFEDTPCGRATAGGTCVIPTECEDGICNSSEVCVGTGWSTCTPTEVCCGYGNRCESFGGC